MLVEVREQIPGSLDFDVRNQFVAQTRNSIDQVAPAFDAIKGPRVHSPILMDVEVGAGGQECSVVLGGLDVPLAGIQNLPFDQRLEEDIGQRDNFPQPATTVEEIQARSGEDTLVEIRAAAVVSDIIRAQIQLRNPEDLGSRELGFGHPDTRLGGGHKQRSRIGEPQCRGEVDR